MTVSILATKAQIVVGFAAWESVDLSTVAAIPPGAYGAIIEIRSGNASTRSFGCESGNSALEITRGISRQITTRFVSLGTGNTVNLYAQDSSTVFFLIGFLTDGGGLYHEGFDKSSLVLAINTWYDVDMSADLPASAKYAIVWLDANLSNTSGALYVRKNGSSVSGIVSSYGAYRIVEMDANRVFEVYSSVAPPSVLRVMGYLEDGHYVDVEAGGTPFGPPPTTATWGAAAGQDFSTKPLVLFQGTTGWGTSDFGGVRPAGASALYDTDRMYPKPGWLYVAPGTAGDVELYHSDDPPTIEFAEYGYFLNPAEGSNPTDIYPVNEMISGRATTAGGN